MPQSWEFYQQPQPGVTLPLLWVAGLCNQGKLSRFDVLSLLPSTIYAVPLDQMQAMTVSQLLIHLVSQDKNSGAACRLGIYQNASSTNNVPNSLVWDAGTLIIDNTADAGILSLSLSQALSSDIRYWVVLFTNAKVCHTQIAALPTGTALPWGVFQNPISEGLAYKSPPRDYSSYYDERGRDDARWYDRHNNRQRDFGRQGRFCFSIARQIVLQNQTFGSLPAFFPTANLSIANLKTANPVPAIALGFASPSSSSSSSSSSSGG